MLRDILYTYLASMWHHDVGTMPALRARCASATVRWIWLKAVFKLLGTKGYVLKAAEECRSALELADYKISLAFTDTGQLPGMRVYCLHRLGSLPSLRGCLVGSDYGCEVVLDRRAWHHLILPRHVVQYMYSEIHLQ